MWRLYSTDTNKHFGDFQTVLEAEAWIGCEVVEDGNNYVSTDGMWRLVPMSKRPRRKRAVRESEPMKWATNLLLEDIITEAKMARNETNPAARMKAAENIRASLDSYTHLLSMM